MRIIFALLLLSVIIYSCKKDFNQNNENRISSSQVDNIIFNDTASQFGIFIQKAYPNTSPSASDMQLNLDDSVKLILDSIYGAKNIRNEINHDAWGVTNLRSNFLSGFKAIWKKGYSQALNIKWRANGVDTAFADSTDYARFVEVVLDSIDLRSDPGEHMKPSLVVVENEESNPGYYDNNSQAKMNKYLGMLRKAADVCQDRSIAVTNGGCVAFQGIILTWDWLKTTYDTATANNWARKVLSPDGVTNLIAGTYNGQINLGKYLIGKYAQINNLTYINLHWYEPVIARYWPEGGVSPYDPPYNKSENNVVAGGLDSVIKYFNVTDTDSRLITNETGQLTYSQTLTNNMINKYIGFKINGGNFPIVIWYDGDNTYDEVISGAKALHNTTSTTVFTLRNSGTKFSNKMH